MSKAKELRTQLNDLKINRRTLELVACLEPISEAYLSTEYNEKSSTKGVLFERFKKEFGYSSWEASNRGRAKLDKAYAKFEAEGWNELYGVIVMRPRGLLCSHEEMADVTDNLFLADRRGSSGYDHDDTYTVLLVPVKTKGDLPNVLEKVREWCPKVKVRHTYSVTEEM